MARESAKSLDEFEARGVEPVFLKQDHAINYAQSRASFRCGEIRILDSSGEVRTHRCVQRDGSKTVTR